MSCLAIDLHTDCFTVAFRSKVDGKSGKLIKKYFLNEKSLPNFAKTLSTNDYVAIEATTNAFWFHDKISPYVKSVIILDTNKINFSGNKTDNNDARRLLDVLEYFVSVKGISEIPRVFVPNIHIRELRELFTSYKLQKKIITQLTNRIHSILKQHGHPITRASLKTVRGKNRAVTLIDNDISRIEIKRLINQFEDAQKDVEIIVQLMAGLGKKYFQDDIERLMTIPGFSFLSAMALIADVADIRRFPSVKKFCSYLRTAPKITESNNTTHLGKVNKCSRNLTVSLLTQSVSHFRESSPYFGEFYDRLKSGKSYGKTRMALIRKILVCAYYMLKRKENFKWSDKSNMERKTKLFYSCAEKSVINLLDSA
ncbi:MULTISPECIES: IS110 family transposase [unclassified Oceanispirochaeta]|uniref:IS110 family transposase n=1 Tax=unclassified Oceanispirochaeta TaxID=2635722 RepID=UPI000E094F84|nr:MULTISPECIES: IS110 family transposase [unclassified Oceanispirochaeta]MBF9018411.1 IS110 family transposase [Oceanispirochaeta sp. M2]NPD75223.1 IS110 family transposase [Oceanispirochaeta sp. M1]RDG28940.1 IS110 family transposase [Oceanispirochaeta sp. M1]